MANGLIHYYYGDGKGKTTAALGLALRFSGHGEKTVIVQFLKSSPCGELEAVKKLDNVIILRGKSGEGFTFSMTEQQLQETKQIHENNLKAAVEFIKEGGLLILDEATDAVETDTLDEKLLKDVILKKNDKVEIVVTGHAPLEWLVDAADYATEMKKHKHPYDSGVAARKGIEF